MSIVFGAIVPHGFSVIPEVSEDAEGGMVTRNSMFEFGKHLAAAKPDVVVIATPHGIRIDGRIALAAAARGFGRLTYEGNTFETNIPLDYEFSDAIATELDAQGTPYGIIGFAGNRKDQSSLPLDWGVITPSYFVGHNRNLTGLGEAIGGKPDEDIAPPIVVVNPSRQLPYDANLEFGRAVAKAADKTGKRVAFVASCDWGHRHQDSGPYGYSPESARVDNIVVDAIKGNDLKSLMSLTEKETSDAAIDGLWQTLMLEGALEGTGAKAEFLSYEHPRYYGMIIALYDIPNA